MKKIKVLGVGNILRSDEGVGVHIAREIENREWEIENVELQVVDGGTLGIDLIPLIENVDKLIIIDAVKNRGRPGTVYKIENRGWMIEDGEKKISLHQIDLIDTLRIMEIQNNLPKEIVIIGVEPKNLDWGEELSDEIKKEISKILNIVRSEIIA